MTDRLTAQLTFLIEADRLKTITRANVLMDGTRRENTAEHSWHLALWALVFADTAPGIDLPRVLSMAILHDLVEIDAGDHPIHLPQDAEAIRVKELAAADRLFALLPADQAAQLRAFWEEFETGLTPEASYLRRLDMTQPLFQELANPAQTEADRDILRQILTTGRSAQLADSWPEVHSYATGLLNRAGQAAPEPLNARLRFLAEADRLKTTLRATTIFDGARRENSAEHSWHLMLFALVLGEHALRPADTGRVMQMLLLHDLVEIDAGDTPIHGDYDAAAMDAAEQAAADRLYGLLPAAQGTALRAIWDEFEAAQSDDAVFGKSLDRVQPCMANLLCGGRSWIDYNVSYEQVDTRVGTKVRRGAPAIWAALSPRIEAWFAENAEA